MEEVKFGGIAISVLLTIALGIIYKVAGEGVIHDRYKALISVLIGMLLGILAVSYQGLTWTVVNVVNNVIWGFMSGAAAVGMYELQRTSRNPRP